MRPLSPYAFTYDAAQPEAPYAGAYLEGFGEVAWSFSPYRLEGQCHNDEIILGYDPVDPAEQTISNAENDVYRRCAFFIYFFGCNVSTENQYLLLFSLRALEGYPSAQFFVGTELVRSEELSGQEQVAILLDAPGDGVTTYMYVRLAAANYEAAFGFQGVDCYLL